MSGKPRIGVQLSPKPTTELDLPDITLILRRTAIRAPRISTTSLSEYAAVFTEAWRKHAACIPLDPDSFFPPPNSSNTQTKLVCQSCSVRVNCLNYSVANRQEFGIWGGMVPKERMKIRRLMEQGVDIEEAIEIVEAKRYGRGVARRDGYLKSASG